MTNPTLERAARAAAEVYFGPDVAITYPTSSVWTDVSRAVLMAVREPTDKIEAAGFKRLMSDQANSSPEGTCSAVFIAMIDAILNDGEKPPLTD